MPSSSSHNNQPAVNTNEAGILDGAGAMFNHAHIDHEGADDPSTNDSSSSFTAPPLAQTPMPPSDVQALSELFPFVSPETISEIIHFQFFPTDLYKLDPTSATKDYPTLASLIDPLFVYFQILGIYAASKNQVSALLSIHRASLIYGSHLSSLDRTYVWPAILEYHFRFFYRRSHEMACGNFSGWYSPDNELLGQHLFGRNQPPPPESYLLFVGFLIFLLCLFLCVVFL